GVVEGGPELRLAGEAPRGVLGAVGVEELDPDSAAEVFVLGQIDRRRPAEPEPADRPVAPGQHPPLLGLHGLAGLRDDTPRHVPLVPAQALSTPRPGFYALRGRSSEIRCLNPYTQGKYP